MRVFLLLVAACTNPQTSGSPCHTTSGDSALFARLTANRWGKCDANNFCLSLQADGDYDSMRGCGDCIETDHGRWNFVARDDTSGLVCFDNGSVIDFELVAGGLRWDAGELPATESLDATGSRAGLDGLAASPLFDQLTAHAWAKTNNFDLYFTPTSFALARDGTFTGSFREGACDVAGTFSVVYGGSQPELHPHAAANVCDTRGYAADIAASNEIPVVEHDGILRFFEASYRDASIVTDDRSFLFSSYSDSNYGLVVGAKWQHDFVASSTSHLDITITNPTPRAQTITKLSLMFDGQPIVDEMLQEAIPPGGTYATSTELSFGAPGIAALLVDVESQDDRQSYANYHGYSVEL